MPHTHQQLVDDVERNAILPPVRSSLPSSSSSSLLPSSSIIASSSLIRSTPLPFPASYLFEQIRILFHRLQQRPALKVLHRTRAPSSRLLVAEDHGKGKRNLRESDEGEPGK
eukprot:751284-Hanusia_phi.AAC.3